MSEEEVVTFVLARNGDLPSKQLARLILQSLHNREWLERRRAALATHPQQRDWIKEWEMAEASR